MSFPQMRTRRHFLKYQGQNVISQNRDKSEPKSTKHFFPPQTLLYELMTQMDGIVAWWQAYGLASLTAAATSDVR